MSRKLSILTPCYNEIGNVRACYEAVRDIMGTHLVEYDYEHIFCDNASTDGTAQALRDLARQDQHVKVILNARNFGPFRSAFNALLSTSGDAVLVYLAADLQDPPELLPEFVSKWQEGYEVVYGVRSQRQEGLIMRFVRRLYYRIVSHLAQIEIPENVGEFQLIDRVVVNSLRQCDDYYPYIRGLIANCGFRSSGINYTWRKRQSGVSKNRLFDLIDQGVNGLISFTAIPLRVCMLFGFSLSVLSILYALIQLAANLLTEREVTAGIPTLIVGMFFFAGIQLFFLGLLGEYIGAIHSQVRKRPLVVEKERINFE